MWFKKASIWLILYALICLNTACKVTPLYKEDAERAFIKNSSSLEQKLKRISIDMPKTRFGQLIAKRLAYLLYNDVLPEESPQYILEIESWTKCDYRGSVNIGDQTAHEGLPMVTHLSGQAYYRLKPSLQDAKKNAKAYKSVSYKVATSFMRSSDAYANMIEEDEASKQAAKALAEQIYLSLLSSFKEKTSV